MSTYYETASAVKINVDKLKEWVNQQGWEIVMDDDGLEFAIKDDEGNHLRVYHDPYNAGKIWTFGRFGSNNVVRILERIQDHFGVVIIDEYHPAYR